VKARLDDLVFKRGLAESKTQAQALILAGKILIDGQPADKAGDKYSEDVQIQKVEELHPYVSRGGVKLTGAIEASGLSVDIWLVFVLVLMVVTKVGVHFYSDRYS
jgi:23S rRNA (cytidine1920-2'-O)/16S rRNA (cytidine1409-2'-O)-methyltransferase